ncbi:MAG: HAD-IC family P-type ATPase, partial [Balneolaceae bacterium]
MSNEIELTLPTKPWAKSAEELTELLGSDPENGLSEIEVKRRLTGFGKNKLREYEEKSIWRILLNQFRSLIIGLLILAATASFLFGEYLDGWAILAVIIISVLIGFFTELRAIRSMEALYRMGRVTTRVLREGNVQETDASQIVPGDIVVVEGGDIVTADIRIIENAGIQADESPLTGESLSVEKETDPLAGNTILAERKNMLYKGTAITRGSGKGVVVATGMKTELGTISSLVHETNDEKTPLEVRLDKLGNRLIGVTLAITAFITLVGIQAGEDLILMIQTGIALAVAAIPEGLPIVATIALAKGIKTMADRNALITRMSSVETLGSTQVIFTDKTGTLTVNRMSVTEYLLSGSHIEVVADKEKPFHLKEDEKNDDVKPDPVLNLALETGVLCNNASLQEGEEDQGTGDPLEVALLVAGEKAGLSQNALLEKYPEVREEAFDAEIKMMATCNQIDSDGYRISVKGAPGAVLNVCDFIADGEESGSFQDEEKEKWKKRN